MSDDTAGEARSALDAMADFAMEELLSEDAARQGRLVRGMAERWPREPALALVYALTSATGGIAAAFGTAGQGDPLVGLGYKLAALAAADVHALQAMGQIPATAEDLLHFWRRADPQELRLH